MNQTDTVSEGIDARSAWPARRRQIALLVVFVICGGCLWFVIPSPTPPAAATILPPDYSIPAPPLPIPDRWIPMTWHWLWRLRSAALPANPTIDIEIRLVRLTNSDEPWLAGMLEGYVSLSNSNGVRAWSIPEEQLDTVSRKLAQKRDNSVRISRMTTGPGVLANQSMTVTVPVGDAQVPVGDFLTHAVRKRGKCVEHTGSFISYDVVTNTANRLSGQREVISLRTNLNLAARLLIPPGQGVFLLDTNRTNTESSGTGLVISAKLR